MDTVLGSMLTPARIYVGIDHGFNKGAVCSISVVGSLKGHTMLVVSASVLYPFVMKNENHFGFKTDGTLDGQYFKLSETDFSSINGSVQSLMISANVDVDATVNGKTSRETVWECIELKMAAGEVSAFAFGNITHGTPGIPENGWIDCQEIK